MSDSGWDEFKAETAMDGMALPQFCLDKRSLSKLILVVLLLLSLCSYFCD